MKYNFKFEQDIQKIKKITDAAKKVSAITQIAKAYKISRATVYRHLKKPVPSLRQVRSDAGKEKKPVAKKDIAVMSEIIKSGKTRKDAKKFLKGVSSHKLSKISKKVKDAEITEAPKVITRGLKEFLEKHFNLEYVSDSSNITLKIGKLKIEITKEDANDIVMILCNAGNRTQDDNNKLKLDRMQFMRSKLIQLLEEKIRIAKQSNSTVKDLEAIMRMHTRLERKIDGLNPNFKVLEKICKELKPDISFDEIFSLVEKYTTE
ncbi:MAG: hypothetical protein HGGPFJEG_03074 [Ignavibacteria bacterium]|nr:hypothetical protein [Ignavibacteria bacterium]